MRVADALLFFDGVRQESGLAYKLYGHRSVKRFPRAWLLPPGKHVLGWAKTRGWSGTRWTASWAVLQKVPSAANRKTGRPLAQAVQARLIPMNHVLRAMRHMQSSVIFEDRAAALEEYMVSGSAASPADGGAGGEGGGGVGGGGGLGKRRAEASPLDHGGTDMGGESKGCGGAGGRGLLVEGASEGRTRFLVDKWTQDGEAGVFVNEGVHTAAVPMAVEGAGTGGIPPPPDSREVFVGLVAGEESWRERGTGPVVSASNSSSGSFGGWSCDHGPSRRKSTGRNMFGVVDNKCEADASTCMRRASASGMLDVLGVGQSWDQGVAHNVARRHGQMLRESVDAETALSRSARREELNEQHGEVPSVAMLRAHVGSAPHTVVGAFAAGAIGERYEKRGEGCSTASMTVQACCVS